MLADLPFAIEEVAGSHVDRPEPVGREIQAGGAGHDDAGSLGTDISPLSHAPVVVRIPHGGVARGTPEPAAIDDSLWPPDVHLPRAVFAQELSFLDDSAAADFLAVVHAHAADVPEIGERM